MKLRSGRELPARVDRLPEGLDNLLETKFQEFKTLFSGNLQHAKGLLYTISKCKYEEHKVVVRSAITSVYDENIRENIEKTMEMKRIGYELMKLVINDYGYNDTNDVIAKRIKNFGNELDETCIEADLIGNIEE